VRLGENPFTAEGQNIFNSSPNGAHSYSYKYHMRFSLGDIIALITLLLWPAIPLFWIPVHCFPRLFRRLGFLTYSLPFITWLPLAILTFGLRDTLLSYHSHLPMIVNVAGVLLFISGICLQTWTIVLLTVPGIMGMPEVTRAVGGRLVTTGPFAVIRHPTYLSHTLILLGLFLWTDVTALAVVALIDAIVVISAVIPLEERELLERFGNDYEEYRRKVPSRFLPLHCP
jgi:protein-S-isoprenylcysteine O-methyltransferase Ste14